MRMSKAKTVKLPRRNYQPKGGGIVEFRIPKKLVKNGGGGCVFIPMLLLKNLGWKPGETEVLVTVNEKDEVILTEVKKDSTMKAAS